MIVYDRDEHNAFHFGSGTTFLQILSSVQEIEAQWEKHKLDNSIRVKTCPKCGPYSYEKQYWSFVQPKHQIFKSWQMFDNAKSLKHLMDKHAVWKQFEQLMGSKCNFVGENVKIDNAVAIGRLHSILLALMKFSDTIPVEFLNNTFLTASLFAVPMVSGSGPRGMDLPLLLDID